MNSGGWRLRTKQDVSAVYSIFTALQPSVGVFYVPADNLAGVLTPHNGNPPLQPYYIMFVVRIQAKKKTPPVLPGGVSECPERKERRKRNGHSKLSNWVGAQSPEERECRRESESLNPVSLGSPPLTNRNVIQYLLFVKNICQKKITTIFVGLLYLRDLLPNLLKILGNRACCSVAHRGIKSRYRNDTYYNQRR